MTTDPLTLKIATLNLIAAGWSEAEVSELVQSIKADAWAKGADAGRRVQHPDTTRTLDAFDANPYRRRVQ